MTKWICPNDETINSGDICIICGMKRVWRPLVSPSAAVTENSTAQRRVDEKTAVKSSSVPSRETKPVQMKAEEKKNSKKGAAQLISFIKRWKLLIAVCLILAVIAGIVFASQTSKKGIPKGYYYASKSSYAVEIMSDGTCYWYEKGNTYKATVKECTDEGYQYLISFSVPGGRAVHPVNVEGDALRVYEARGSVISSLLKRAE